MVNLNGGSLPTAPLNVDCIQKLSRSGLCVIVALTSCIAPAMSAVPVHFQVPAIAFARSLSSVGGLGASGGFIMAPASGAFLLSAGGCAGFLSSAKAAPASVAIESEIRVRVFIGVSFVGLYHLLESARGELTSTHEHART